MRERDTEALSQSALRGAEARALLEHPLLVGILTEMQEKTTQAILSLPVEANDQRLALCTVLRVLRGLPHELSQMATTGDFDALQLARMSKDDDRVRN